MTQPETRQQLAANAAKRARSYSMDACARRWYVELMS